MHPEAERAARLIQAHKAVAGQVSAPRMLDAGGFRIVFEMEVSLPSRARAIGISETGVKAQERVVLHFPSSYPLKAPRIYLRHDFNRSLPHFNPMPGFGEGDLVAPCVYEGSLDELMHRCGDGLSEILNHLSEWLGKAAMDDLIDPDQGWEPIRRDDILGAIIFDAGKLRRIVESQPQGGAVFLGCTYAQNHLNGRYWISRISEYDPGPMKAASLANILAFRRRFEDMEIMASVGIFAWPDVVLDGSTAAICGKYLPENVSNLEELFERADDYGCGQSLRSKLSELTWVCSCLNLSSFPIFIILSALRPYPLIGETSRLELIPYAVEYSLEASMMGHKNFVASPASNIWPLGHRHALSTELLNQLSGVRKAAGDGPIVQLGCGSLGSKIVMHLARSGNGPFLLCDKHAFSPHNAARHALTGHPEFPGQSKAILLAAEVRNLRQRAETDFDDIVQKCHAIKIEAYQLPADTRLVIDATGSLSVREALSSLLPDQIPGRLLHTALIADGEVGIMAVEGPGRNPNIGDLVVRFFDRRIEDVELASRLARGINSVQRQSIGSGCSSYTMTMPDTRVSLFAAGMAERARQVLEEAPSEAEIWIGLLDESKVGVSWKRFTLRETTVIKKGGWEIRLLKEAIDQISEETKIWGSLETGGVLIGSVSILRRCFTVSRVLEAPPDSLRSENSFVLGIKDLKKNVRDAWSRSGESLNYVGVWHSHPNGGGPSALDRMSLMKMRVHRLGAPCISLIWTPERYEILIDAGRIA